MVYFDTNIAIYTLCKNIDDVEQKKESIQLFETAIKNQNLILSEIVLYEFAFISKKLKENEKLIDDNLKFLSKYVKITNHNIYTRVLKILEQTSLYNSSFDIYHLAFCENYNAKLITYDKGFKKLKGISEIEIIIK